MKAIFISIALASTSAAYATNFDFEPSHYTVDVQFTGILSSGNDTYGNVLNSAGTGIGAGINISGHFTFRPIGPFVNVAVNGFSSFDSDLRGRFTNSSDAQIQGSLTVGNTTYDYGLNFGSSDWSNIQEGSRSLAGSGPDSIDISKRSEGHYQLSPTVNGLYDYEGFGRSIYFSLIDSSGNLLAIPSWSQPIDWVSGRDTGEGTGNFSFYEALYRNGSDMSFSGTLDGVFTEANGTFVLTSYQSAVVSSVPVPSAIWFFSSGLVGLFSAACKGLKRSNQ